jgi:hypothetical protein
MAIRDGSPLADDMPESFLNNAWSLWPLLVIGLMILAALWLTGLFGLRPRMPYTRRRKLVSRSELAFYRVLRQAVNNEWEIFAMVRIADLLSVPKGTPNHRSWLNKVLSKHIDFVLCDRETLEVMAGIELDDRSHSLPARVRRDQFVNAAFADAGLPLLRFPAADNYDTGLIRRAIEKALR